MSVRRKCFYIFTVTVVAMLLLLPATGWLARLQLLPFTHRNAVRSWEATASNPEVQAERFQADAQAAITANHDDFDLRYAHALSGKSADVVKQLERLSDTYPGEPKIFAAILRYMTLGPVQVKRSEAELLKAASHRRENPPRPEKPSDPAEVARFIAYAKQGEVVEPQNAYFSVMAAVGYFASQQDEKAIAAWVRAGNKPVWNEYTADDVTARWKLQRAMNNGTEVGSISRMSSMAAILFPHYAAIRASGRMATVKAVQAELAGKKEDGLALRRASRQVGEKIVVQGKHMIPCLLGYAVVGISSARPGGAEHPEGGDGESGDEKANAREARYVAYLREIGHAEEATAFQNATLQGKSVKNLWYEGQSLTYWGFDSKTYQWLGAWFVNFLLIAGVLFSLVFAGIFKLVYKFSPRLQKGESLQKSARWGVTVGLALPLIAGLVTLSMIGLWLEPDYAMLVASVTGITALVAPPFMLRLSVRETGHGMMVMLATIGSLAALIGAGAMCGLFAQSVLEMVGLLTAVPGGDVDAAQKSVEEAVRLWAVGGIVLSVPLGLLALFGVFSKILRVPFAAGVTRGMRAMAVPLACVLTLLWAISFLYTLRHERAAMQEMERMAAIGEAKYIAGILKRSFPQ
ncbi:MAG: hypothetical protein H8F28_03600 [Fibrella sp.]|nr:hypothetical protein [Armatimonadota bacterium]